MDDDEKLEKPAWCSDKVQHDDRLANGSRDDQTGNTSQTMGEERVSGPQLDDPGLDDHTRLQLLCDRLIEIRNHSQHLQGDASSQLTDAILHILTTDDLQHIKNTPALHSFFVDHLRRLPSKIVSELLSVLIAVLKKSVFNLDSSRGLLVPSIYQLLDIHHDDHQDDTNTSNNISTSNNNNRERPTSNDNGESLMKHFLREWINLLISHTCDVKELKSIIRFSEYDSKLLDFVRHANLNQRNRPHAFFAFPATKGSMIALAPFQKWPTQNGWSFSTWFCIEPKANNSQPYLFCFKTSKTGLGYSAHFTGNCLVLTSMKVKGKGVQHCIAYEFQSYKWVHCAITYISKWRASEIKVYVNGQLSANIEMAWQVQTNEIFDKCFIGGSGSMSLDRSELNCFCGQMSAIYLFNEGLSAAQICSIHRLGPSYMGQFKYSNESQVYLPTQISKVLYEEKLASSLFCLYTPVAVDGGTLCLQSAPLRSSTSSSAQNFFMSSPHAALLGQTKAIVTQPICSTLQSIGCSRSLFPLLNVFASKGDAEACSTLIGFLCDLLECSPHWFANEIIQTHGFVIIACSLTKNSRQLFTQQILDIFLNLTKSLITASKNAGDSLLLKHLMDNILFNPALWIYVDAKLQINLYSYLAREFLHGTKHVLSLGNASGSSQMDHQQQHHSSSGSILGGGTFVGGYSPTTSASAAVVAMNQQYGSSDSQTGPSSLGGGGNSSGSSSNCTDFLFGEIRRVSTVLQSLHALKYYYWLAEEKDIQLKARDLSLRPNYADLCKIRSQILLFIKELILRSISVPHDEIQGILNYLSTVSSDENLLDVLNMLESLMNEYPATLIPAFDAKQGIKVIFKLVSAPNEDLRIQALRLLGLFLSKSNQKLKQDVMGPYNLFMLLCEILKRFTPLTYTTYRALYQILIESTTVLSRHPSQEQQFQMDYQAKIENPMILKVIASLIIDGKKVQQTPNLEVDSGESAGGDQMDIRRVFISDMWNLIVNSRENRRTVLQMSVWQHWLINLIDFDCNNSDVLRDQILAIFRVLLYHAIRYEYGGWRVWIDTLAIIHTKVSYDDFVRQFGNLSISKSSQDDLSTSHPNETRDDEEDTDGEDDDEHYHQHSSDDYNSKSPMPVGDDCDCKEDDEITKDMEMDDASIVSDEKQAKSASSQSSLRPPTTGDSAIQSITSEEMYNNDGVNEPHPGANEGPQSAKQDQQEQEDATGENEAKSLNVQKLEKIDKGTFLGSLDDEGPQTVVHQNAKGAMEILAEDPTMESIDLAEPSKQCDDVATTDTTDTTTATTTITTSATTTSQDDTSQTLSPSHVISISEKIHKEESAIKKQQQQKQQQQQQQQQQQRKKHQKQHKQQPVKDGDGDGDDNREDSSRHSQELNEVREHHLEEELEDEDLEDDEEDDEDEEEEINLDDDAQDASVAATATPPITAIGRDSVDLAPTRAYRKIMVAADTLATAAAAVPPSNEGEESLTPTSVAPDDDDEAPTGTGSAVAMEEEAEVEVEDDDLSCGSPLQGTSTNDESTGTTTGSQESSPSSSSQQHEHHLHHHDIVNEASKLRQQQSTAQCNSSAPGQVQPTGKAPSSQHHHHHHGAGHQHPHQHQHSHKHPHHHQHHHQHHQHQQQQQQHQQPHPKISATPAFRIPEFRWSHLLIKLLNDLMFSIECDLFHWKCLARQMDQSSLAAGSSSKSTTGHHYHFSSGQTSSKLSSGQTSDAKTAATQHVNSPTPSQMEQILQSADKQIYIINIIHFVSQLCDNIVIASGGLLPLLAEATGGSKQPTPQQSGGGQRAGGQPHQQQQQQQQQINEGLTMAQANSLLYRLVSLMDTVVFSASHVNLGELEADKNTTNGGILRQCLRLSSTVAVKNCLIVQRIMQRIMTMGIGGNYTISSSDFPRDLFDNYLGCSIVSASELFVNSALRLDQSDLVVDGEFSPHQTPNAGSSHSFLPFQSVPIKDPNKLLQTIDVNRIQACIYRDSDPDSRQSQFLALASLYFISVLMVSKYRDIIEPKQRDPKQQQQQQQAGQSNAKDQPPDVDIGASISASTTSISATSAPSAPSVKAPESQGPIVSESDHYTISKQSASFMLASSNHYEPVNGHASNAPMAASASNSISEMLTNRLETTLSSVCPLLRDIMCDFSQFLSRTLLGSYGQDLVSKEAVRTFRKPNTSPVELVMLLCSQEWQNTLQKNAGLTFIELINEGRILSHGMKDHIVRVAMEAEFILNRLRADDVAKHEQFQMSCMETQSTRVHEEALVNSLICSAKRRDYVLHNRFKEQLTHSSDISTSTSTSTSTHIQTQTHMNAQLRRHYKLDNWEDDDRRRRRFILDSWQDDHQLIYTGQHQTGRATRQELSSAAADQQPLAECPLVVGVPDAEEPRGDFAGDPEKRSSKSGGKPADQLAGAHQLEGSGAGGRGDNNGDQARDDYTMWNDCDDQGAAYMSDCEPGSDFSGSVLFAAECSLIWNIYAIDGILQLTAHELYFEPHQSINDAIDSLKRESLASKHQNQSKRPTLSSNPQLDNTNNGALDGHNHTHHHHNHNHNHNHNQQQQQQLSGKSIRKLDLKVLKYCDFLAYNGKILLSDIRAVFTRHYLLQQTALEIFLSHRTSVMFAFADYDTVKRVIKFLPPVGVGIKYGIQQSRRASLMTPRQLFASANMTQKWQRREISNFQYLMYLNTIAGRTYQDLNQYPVFPWILTNYDTQELDLTLPTNFRDLSKPVGALNNDRRLEFIERYQSWDNAKVPAFHYGTHYSTAAFTLSWMSRMRGQFHTAYMALQDGKYEDDSRLFLSLGDSWMGALVGGQQNVKELIPEFYYLPEIFAEAFGMPPVELPPWCESPEHFVRLHRQALESELVSCQLHQWIDLIFGYKQRGPEAVRAINVFYYLTYQGNVNLQLIQDGALRDAIETQIRHFGQTPSQLTTEPHPPRSSALHVAPLMFSPILDELCQVVKFPFNAPIVHISACVLHNSSAASLGDSGEGASTGATCPAPHQQGPYLIVTITANHHYQINKWHSRSTNGQPLVVDPLLGGVTTTTTTPASSGTPTSVSTAGQGTNSGSASGNSASQNSATGSSGGGTNNHIQSSSSSSSSSSFSLSTTSNSSSNSTTATTSTSTAAAAATTTTTTTNVTNTSNTSSTTSSSAGATTTTTTTTTSSSAASASKRQLIDINDMCSGVSIPLRQDDYHMSVGVAGRHPPAPKRQARHHQDGMQQLKEEVVWSTTHYIVTLDGRHIIMGSFYDNSFRVFSTDHGKLSQVIYGHRGPITCIARSECNALADFYVATGSQDCSVLLWTWNAKYSQIEGSGVSAVHNPLPKLTISGHESPILSVLISAELGLIISGSRNMMLVHTTTYAECLVEINLNRLPLHRHHPFEHQQAAGGANQHPASGGSSTTSSSSNILRPYVKDKQRANLEASMLGDDLHAAPNKPPVPMAPSVSASATTAATDLGQPSPTGAHHEAAHNGTSAEPPANRDAPAGPRQEGACQPEANYPLPIIDYFVTQTRLARELAFIACLAVPAPTKTDPGTSGTNNCTNDQSGKRRLAAPKGLLLTYNLRGELMRHTQFGDGQYPRLGDCCLLQTTRDGEHLILTDSPNLVKIIRTFDLEPVYTLSTNNQTIPSQMGQEANRVRSLSLVEHKYLLVGLDNGKLIVYNIDYKNL